MIAVVKTGGKQYKISEGDVIQVEKLDGKVGETINLDKVLICGEGNSIKVGSPYLEGCSIVCEVTEQLRGKKIIVFKKHRRKNYRRKNGHRQSLTRLRVTGITAP
jgi:large subunit ribosomal protein L21|tara:strand:+ start:2035 stop:2349 length:315 start_codon:yes stop_codon:yes gene_type:complete